MMSRNHPVDVVNSFAIVGKSIKRRNLSRIENCCEPGTGWVKTHHPALGWRIPFPCFSGVTSRGVQWLAGVMQSVSWQSWNSSPGICLQSALAVCFTKTKDRQESRLWIRRKAIPMQEAEASFAACGIWERTPLLFLPPVDIGLTVLCLDGVISTEHPSQSAAQKQPYMSNSAYVLCQIT